MLYSGYHPPHGFCYNQFYVDTPIQDDPKLYDLNVKETVDRFVSTTCKQAAQYKTNHIILTMGADFMYENANLWYRNLDKLIKYVNRVGVAYLPLSARLMPPPPPPPPPPPLTRLSEGAIKVVSEGLMLPHPFIFATFSEGFEEKFVFF